MTVQRLSLGVPELDQAILGGVPKGSLVLVLGPPGAGKSILGKLYLHGGLKAGDFAFLVSTSETEQAIADTLSQFNWAGGVAEKLRVLDCYSWRLGGKRSKYSVPLTSLTDVSLTLTKLFGDSGVKEGGNERVVIDSFTDFIKYDGVDKSLKFLDYLRAKLREFGVTGLLLLEEGVHAPRTIAAVEYSTDGTIRMRVSDQGRFMMASRMQSTPIAQRWIPFTIGR
jgi:KaiC/GvpD/RAD55 family RecA-like ATPase